MDELHPSLQVVADLHQRYPRTPFLTLGQTVLWDEPLKVAFCRVLERLAPDSLVVAAVHNTDYFAKLPHVDNRPEANTNPPPDPYMLLEHNDGPTRALWSAAGEIACLFGSETMPTRQLLTESGVAFDRVAHQYPGGGEALLVQETAAWGWRALVHTHPHPLIAAEVRLSEVGPALQEQMLWALETSQQSLVEPRPEIPTLLLEWVREYCSRHPGETLTGLYRYLTPRLWSLIRGEGSCNLTTSDSLTLFRCNRETAGKPLFRLVDIFLSPATRELACAAYNEAVRGSGIYTLNQFGDGALPFDVVVPGRGRGTLHVAGRTVTIHMEQPLVLNLKEPCESVTQLAAALEDTLEAPAALVGKAVSLITMLAHEFIFVFHEKASSYTTRTQHMNQLLREAGVTLDLHPLLRLRHQAWDALDATTVDFHLPPHLAAAFGQQRISGPEFAQRWRGVTEAQDQLRASLRDCRSPRELMALLAEREDGNWPVRMAEYDAAREVIGTLRRHTLCLEEKTRELQAGARGIREEVGARQVNRGQHFRAHVLPLLRALSDVLEAEAERRLNQPKRQKSVAAQFRAAPASGAAKESQPVGHNAGTYVVGLDPAAEAAAHEAQLREELRGLQQARVQEGHALASRLEEAHQMALQAHQLVEERVSLERSPEARTARATIRRLEYEAELERLRLVRNAILVSHGLRYTNHRPTAWWFPLVSPDHRWFNRLLTLVEARVEDL